MKEKLRIEDVTRWCRTALLFEEEYRKFRGIIGISEEGVHMSYDAFMEMFPDYQKIFGQPTEDSICVYLNGARVYTLRKKGELK